MEANLWGRPKSSGSFSTLFRRRLLPAIDYCEEPFELRPRNGRGSDKVFGLSAPMRLAGGGDAAAERSEVSCGDSADSCLPDKHVDLVVTAPPFFDNVHYSELADFFFVWQCHWRQRTARRGGNSTRSPAEVQHTAVAEFRDRLQNVWRECHRVLGDDGLLVFTYHHSRQEGWEALLGSLVGAGFPVVQVHPVKSEMSVAMPKHQSREPIDYDMVFVCRKRSAGVRDDGDLEDVVDAALRVAASQVSRLAASGRTLAKGDLRALLQAHVVAELSRRDPSPAVERAFESISRALAGPLDALLAAPLGPHAVP